jgi:predicted transcriptional regulator
MIDFACKQFDLKQIIKCGLGLTKSDFVVMEYFLSHRRECRTSSISENLNLNLTTVQKAVKKLFDKGVIIRHQKNLGGGGYVYTYECNSKFEIRRIVKSVIRKWSERVEEEIDKW